MSALHHELKAGLAAAMKRRDISSAKVLRTTLAAIDNAQAVPMDDGPAEPAIGAYASEVARADITDAQVRGLVEAEIAERRDAAAVYDGLEQADRAAALRAEADVLAPYAGAT